MLKEGGEAAWARAKREKRRARASVARRGWWLVERVRRPAAGVDACPT
jgi:hypothetical protein